jgi:hypothetical protein
VGPAGARLGESGRTDMTVAFGNSPREARY